MHFNSVVTNLHDHPHLACRDVNRFVSLFLFTMPTAAKAMKAMKATKKPASPDVRQPMKAMKATKKATKKPSGRCSTNEGAPVDPPTMCLMCQGKGCYHCDGAGVGGPYSSDYPPICPVMGIPLPVMEKWQPVLGELHEKGHDDVWETRYQEQIVTESATRSQPFTPA